MPTAYFDWQGKQYRLYKRRNEKSAAWYFQIKRNGRAIPTSTKTNHLDTAIKKAKAILEADAKGQLAAVLAILAPRNNGQQHYCTLGDIFKRFDATPLDVGQRHRDGIRYSANKVLRTATGETGDIEQLSAAILSADTARRYFERVTVQARRSPRKRRRPGSSAQETLHGARWLAYSLQSSCWPTSAQDWPCLTSPPSWPCSRRRSSEAGLGLRG